MSDQDERLATGVELGQQSPHIRGRGAVQRSRGLVGKQQRGRFISALATATRWRCPPDRRPGKALAC